MEILGVDIGGSGIKGAIVDTDSGTLLTERIRIKTPQPATPEAIADTLKELVETIKWDGPVSCGFHFDGASYGHGRDQLARLVAGLVARAAGGGYYWGHLRLRGSGPHLALDLPLPRRLRGLMVAFGFNYRLLFSRGSRFGLLGGLHVALYLALLPLRPGLRLRPLRLHLSRRHGTHRLLYDSRLAALLLKARAD